MKNSWLIWLFIVGVVITVLVAFNYQGSNNAVPLSEIFPSEQSVPVDIAYEFVDESEIAQPVAAKETTQQIPSAQQPLAAKTEIKTEAKAEVKKEATPAAAIAPKQAIKLDEIPFTIQVASFKTKEAADTSLKRILDKGYPGYVVSKDLGEKGTWHRVYVGTFQTKPQAEQELTKVKSDYPSSFIISPK